MKKLKGSQTCFSEPKIIVSKINEEKSCFLPQFFVVVSTFILILCHSAIYSNAFLLYPQF